MSDRLVSSVPWVPFDRVSVTRQLVFLPIGTNGYVSTWGAQTSVRPPKGR